MGNTVTVGREHASSVEIYFKDWGEGRPVVFSHGWPLNSDVWDPQMMYLADRGYRVIAHDRRGHGRSSQPWTGHDMDTYADDLAKLMDSLDLNDAVLVGHSTGGGEVARYIGRYGASRVSKAVLVGAVTPHMLRTESNLGGVPITVFNDLRAGLTSDRSQFYADLSLPFYGCNRTGVNVSKGLRDAFWLQSMQANLKAAYHCIKAFSETDFTDDLKKFDIPTLIIHGDDDQMVPITASSVMTATLVKRSTFKIYPGASHGLAQTQPDEFNADLLAFISSE